MNKVIMVARLTRDPEVRYAASGSAVGRFSIAVDRRFKKEGQPSADFFNCTVFGKQAEFTEKYLRKGAKMVIIGSLQNNDYTNKDGQKVKDVQIIVDEMEFAESKAQQEPAQPTPKDMGNGFMKMDDLSDDELPFS